MQQGCACKGANIPQARTAQRHANQVCSLPTQMLQQRQSVGGQASAAVLPEVLEDGAAANAPAHSIRRPGSVAQQERSSCGRRCSIGTSQKHLPACTSCRRPKQLIAKHFIRCSGPAMGQIP